MGIWGYLGTWKLDKLRKQLGIWGTLELGRAGMSVGNNWGLGGTLEGWMSSENTWELGVPWRA